MALKKPKREDPPENTEKWMTTFSDLVSLMLTFFILLVSMSTLDQTGLADISTYFQKAVSVMENGDKTEIQVMKPLEMQRPVTPKELILAMRQKSKKVLKNSKLQYKIKARLEGNHLLFRMDDLALFPENSSELKPGTRTALLKFAQIIASEPGKVLVSGHSASIKNATDKQISKLWRISLERAVVVADTLREGGVTPSRIKIAGYGDSKPLNLKDTDYARKQNRRVDIIIYDTNTK